MIRSCASDALGAGNPGTGTGTGSSWSGRTAILEAWRRSLASAARSAARRAGSQPSSAAITVAVTATSASAGGPAVPRSRRRSTASARLVAISSRTASRTRSSSGPSRGRARGSGVNAVRHAGTGRPSRRATRSTAVSATPRAVVYFTPSTDRRPGTPSSASWSSQSGARAKAGGAALARNEPAMDERQVAWPAGRPRETRAAPRRGTPAPPRRRSGASAGS